MPSEVLPSGAHHDREPTTAELKLELAESHRRERASAEVLAVISRISDTNKSGRNLQPVLDAVTKAAVRLCEADKGLMRLREDNKYVHASTFALSVDFNQWGATTALEAGGDSIVGQAAQTRKTVHVPDVLAGSTSDPGDWQRLADFRSAVAVPLVGEGDIFGVLVLHRSQPIAFTDEQIALVESFAAQAVIALDNARLFEELTRTIEQQKTTGDILRAIANSHGNVQLVLDSIAESVARLLEVTGAEIIARRWRQSHAHR